jgi:hypothetical protein
LRHCSKFGEVAEIYGNEPDRLEDRVLGLSHITQQIELPSAFGALS